MVLVRTNLFIGLRAAGLHFIEQLAGQILAHMLPP